MNGLNTPLVSLISDQKYADVPFETTNVPLARKDFS